MCLIRTLAFLSSFHSFTGETKKSRVKLPNDHTDIYDSLYVWVSLTLREGEISHPWSFSGQIKGVPENMDNFTIVSHTAKVYIFLGHPLCHDKRILLDKTFSSFDSTREEHKTIENRKRSHPTKKLRFESYKLTSVLTHLPKWAYKRHLNSQLKSSLKRWGPKILFPSLDSTPL